VVVELAVAGFEEEDSAEVDFEAVDFEAALLVFAWVDIDRVVLPLGGLGLVE
jgi:hypothetical protein